MLQATWGRFVHWVARQAGFTQQRAHHFYPGSLSRDSVVVDLGAHKGEFSRYVVETFGCQVLGLEANPRLHAELPELPGVQFRNLAVHTRDEPVVFHLSENPEASSLLEDVAMASGALEPVSVPGCTLDTLWRDERLGDVALLKVDIESAEFAMLETTSLETLGRAAQITVEFHLVPGSGEYSAERVERISRRLAPLGFVTFVMDAKFTDVLFLNLRRIRATTRQRAAMQLYRRAVMPMRNWIHSR